MTPPRAGRAISIEHKLPLLIGGLLLVVVAAYTWATYRELRRSAYAAAADRLRGATGQLAELVGNSTRRVHAVTRAAGGDPLVRAYLRGGVVVPPDSVRTHLRPLVAPPDQSQTVELLDPRGDRRLALGEPPPRPETEGVADVLRDVPPLDTIVSGPLRVLGDRVFASTVVPVVERGALLGYVVRWARIGAADSARRTITELTGLAESSIYFVHGPTGLTLDFAGVPVARPAGAQSREPVFEYDREGAGRRLAARAGVRGTPWLLVSELPHDAVLARPRTLLRRMSLFAFLLVAAGAGAGWLISRRITRPLRDVTRAADAVAAGDFSRRVAVDRGDEIGRLAASFNTMSASVRDAQGRIEAARGAAESANQAKSQFLATMSHEIRTPLNAIIGYTDLLAAGVAGPLTDKQAQFLERTRASGRHLLTLVDDVLDLSKIEADGMHVRRDTAPIGPVVEAALTLVEPQARARELTLADEWRRAARLSYRGDPERVRQILVNLLSNAVKFTPPGGRVTVRAGVAQHPPPDAHVDGGSSWTWVAVEDTGVGIPADRLPAVWESFVQADTGHTRAYGGTGLGLTISRRLARLMDGDLTAKSTVGAGSTFTLWLPGA